LGGISYSMVCVNRMCRLREPLFIAAQTPNINCSKENLNILSSPQSFQQSRLYKEANGIRMKTQQNRGFLNAQPGGKSQQLQYSIVSIHDL
jgi:hypothetical protein